MEVRVIEKKNNKVHTISLFYNAETKLFQFLSDSSGKEYYIEPKELEPMVLDKTFQKLNVFGKKKRGILSLLF